MYRKNTAGQFVCFQGVDATTGGIKSGVTWTMRRCIDGTFAAGGATVTEDSTNGWYKAALTQADTNGNDISYNFTGTGAVPQTVNIITTAADPTDGVRFGLTALPNAAAGANTGLPVVGTQIPNATAGAAGGVFIAGTNAATTVTTAFTTTFTGNLTGSVGSVTGAVGSVTGAVGSVTGLTAANLDVAVSTRLATAGYTSPPSATSIADAVLSRDVSNVEGSAGQNTLCGVVLGTFHWSISGTDWVITKTGGGPFATVPTTDTPGAFPITAVG